MYDKHQYYNNHNFKHNPEMFGLAASIQHYIHTQIESDSVDVLEALTDSVISVFLHWIEACTLAAMASSCMHCALLM